MHKFEFESCGRSMRWYEWIAGLCLLGVAAGVRAEAVYKCVDTQGGVSYQDTGCSAQQQQTAIAIAPTLRSAPQLRHTPNGLHAAERPREPASLRSVAMPREHAPKEMAYECHVSDGRVFYRLAACPRTVPDGSGNSTATRHGKSGSAHAGGSVQVASHHVSREAACHEIHRAGAIGRNGHEFDEHVSTYEHNLGHDPCKF